MSLNVLIYVLMVTLVYFVLVDCASYLEGKGSHLIKTGTLSSTEPRKKQQQQDVFSKILPMLAGPFIMQTTFLPMVLMGMKFMLLNSIFIGKLALILWTFNLLRSRNDDRAGLYSHNVNVEHNEHPGHFYGIKHQRNSGHYEDTNEERGRRRKKRNSSQENNNK